MFPGVFSVPLLIVVGILLVTVLVCGSIYTRDGRRAFYVGALIPALIHVLLIVETVGFVAWDYWDSLLQFLEELVDSMEVVLPFTSVASWCLSILSGLLAVGMRAFLKSHFLTNRKK